MAVCPGHSYILKYETSLSGRTAIRADKKDSRQCRRLRIWLLIFLVVFDWNPEERLDVIAGTLTPVTGMLPAYIIEIIIAFLIEVAVTLVLKKLPVFRKLL